MTIRSITVEQARILRREVLKPGLPESEVRYPGDDDANSFHLGAFEAERLIGIATFLRDPCPAAPGVHDWRLRGMATIAAVRGQGIGGELLERGVGRAHETGALRVWCNGRTGARQFYERHQFRALGAEFQIPHSGPHYLFVRDLAPRGMGDDR